MKHFCQVGDKCPVGKYPKCPSWDEDLEECKDDGPEDCFCENCNPRKPKCKES